MSKTGSVLFAAVCHGGVGIGLVSIASLVATELAEDAAVMQQVCYTGDLIGDPIPVLLVGLTFFTGCGLLALSLNQLRSAFKKEED